MIKVNNGKINFIINSPERMVSWDNAKRVADKVWVVKQINKAKIAHKNGQNRIIPLTKPNSSMRMGGGFVQIEGNYIIIQQRPYSSVRRPGVFCEQGGVFNHPSGNLILNYVLESLEVVRINKTEEKEVILASFGQNYDKLLLDEFKTTISKDSNFVFSNKIEQKKVEILTLKNSVGINFAEQPKINMTPAWEIDTSSLEFCGVLRFPKGSYRYMDGEGTWIDGKFILMNREIHKINILSGEDEIWQSGKRSRTSTIQKEIEKIDISKSGGLIATEKLRSAIKGLPMEAPGLQPLIK